MRITCELRKDGHGLTCLHFDLTWAATGSKTPGGAGTHYSTGTKPGPFFSGTVPVGDLLPVPTNIASVPPAGERRCQRGAYRSTTGVARPSQKPTFAPVVGVLYPVRCRECRFSTISENAMRRATLPLAFVPVATAVAAAHAVAKGSIPRLPLFVRARAVPAITAASI